MANIPLEEPIPRTELDLKWFELRGPKGPNGSARIKVYGMSSTTGDVDPRAVVDSVNIPITSLSEVDDDGNLLNPESAALFAHITSKMEAVIAERKAAIEREQNSAE